MGGGRAILGGPVAGPYIALAAAVLLPGAGHVIAGYARRGLMTQVFIILLALISWHLTTPAQSLIGRLSGGLFVYALSIPEAYRLAKLRALTAPSQAQTGQAASATS